MQRTNKSGPSEFSADGQVEIRADGNWAFHGELRDALIRTARKNKVSVRTLLRRSLKLLRA
jgi:hypothetical protein